MDAMVAATDLAAAQPLALELALDPAQAAVFWRAPALAPWRQGRRVGRAEVALRWHDTADRTLAAAGLAVVEQQRGARVRWRLDGAGDGPAVLHPRRCVAEARTASALMPALSAAAAAAADAELVPLAALDGRLRWLGPAGGAWPGAVRLLAGTLAAAEARRVVARVTLEGPADQVFGQARALAATLRLSLPPATLAAEAAALAGAPLPPPHLGVPALPPEITIEQAVALVLDQLAGALLHWVPRVGADGDPEAVHQMRVALRRLRSALKLFARAVDCPALDAAQDGLRALAGSLGVARDWDVFLGGLGRRVAETFAGERAIARMLRAAERQRRGAYATLGALLDGPQFRQLSLTLAELAATRPWRAWIPADPALAEQRAAAQASTLAEYGRDALHRRLRRARHAGRGFAGRSSAELHALRIQCKRLRYSCELLAPAFPGHAARRYAKGAAAVQDDLGHLNDGAVAAALMQQLGAGQGLASGLVRGFVAAHEAQVRARAERSWRRLRRAEPFWA